MLKNEAAYVKIMVCRPFSLAVGRLKKKKKKEKMKKIAVWPISVYNSSDVFCTTVRRLKRLTNVAFGRIQVFPMYGSLDVSAPSPHRESTDSLIH